MKSSIRLAPLFLLAALPLFVASTCSQRQLDPAGPYAGDTLLATFDQVLIQTTAVFDDVIALADRNPAVVAANPKLAEGVAKIRAELDGVPHPNETLTRMFAARDAYKAARNSITGEALTKEIATARTVLETARTLLPLFVEPLERRP